MRYYKRKIKCGFTLLEILVALSIVILILSAVYGSYRAAASSISYCDSRTNIEHQARLFLFRITSELRCCYAGRLELNDQNILQNISPQDSEDFVSRKETERMFFGEQVRTGNIFLRFVTTSFASGPNQNIGGLAILSYKLDNSGTVLLRSIRKYTEMNEDQEKDLQWIPILTDIKTISCEFLKEDKWLEEWNSKETKVLPRAVKISIVLDNEEAGTLSFVSCAYLMCSESENSKIAESKPTSTRNFR